MVCRKGKSGGIEFGYSEGRFDAPVYRWCLWNTYTSQRRMLQALSDFRKLNPATTKKCATNSKGENVNCIQFYDHYRPVHVNYGL